MDINALVVDDSGIMRKLVMRALTQSKLANFTFEQACDGVDALEKFDPKATDILFVDWNMPNMNGIELIKRVREMVKHNLPIVMITTESTVGKIDEATAEVQVDKYIAKPFTPDVLQNRLGPLFDQMAEDRKNAKGFFSKLVDKIA